MNVPLEMSPSPSLMERAQSGDRGAFAELARPACPSLLRSAYHIARNRDDAEEIVQEALLKAFQHIASYRGEAAFSTWLIRITLNQALMFVRKRRLDTIPLDDLHIESYRFYSLLAPEIRTPEQIYAAREMRILLADLIHRIRPKYRSVLTLKADEKTHEEIAEHLDMPVKAVRVCLHRARRELRLMLERRLREGTREREAA